MSQSSSVSTSAKKPLPTPGSKSKDGSKDGGGEPTPVFIPPLPAETLGEDPAPIASLLSPSGTSSPLSPNTGSRSSRSKSKAKSTPVSPREAINTPKAFSEVAGSSSPSSDASPPSKASPSSLVASKSTSNIRDPSLDDHVGCAMIPEHDSVSGSNASTTSDGEGELYWRERALRAEGNMLRLKEKVSELEKKVKSLKKQLAEKEKSLGEESIGRLPKWVEQDDETISDSDAGSLPSPHAPPSPGRVRENLETSDLIVINGSIRGGTLDALLERLLNDKPDLATLDISAFLATYPNFTERHLILTKLIELGTTPALIKRIGHILSTWAMQFPEDLLDDPSFHDRFVSFFTDHSLSPETLTYLSTMSERSFFAMSSETPPKPELATSPNDPLMAWPPIEIARQIALIHWDMFSRLRLREFAHCNWIKDKKEITSPIITHMSTFFNHLNLIVATSVCLTEKLKDRIKTLSKWVRVAERLLHLGDFQGMMAILSGIECSVVHRMRETTEAVMSDRKFALVLAELKQLSSPQQNYGRLRAMTKQRVPPLIPFLGLFLTDFTFGDEGNSDTVGNGLINMMKWQLIADNLLTLKNMQRVGFALQPVESLQRIIKDFRVQEMDVLHSVSLYLEPREGSTPGERPSILDEFEYLVSSGASSSSGLWRDMKDAVKKRSSISGKPRSNRDSMKEHKEKDKSETAIEEEGAAEDVTIFGGFSLESPPITRFVRYLQKHKVGPLFEYYKKIEFEWKELPSDSPQLHQIALGYYKCFFSTESSLRLDVPDDLIAAVKEVLLSKIFEPCPFTRLLEQHVLPQLVSHWEAFSTNKDELAKLKKNHYKSPSRSHPSPRDPSRKSLSISTPLPGTSDITKLDSPPPKSPPSEVVGNSLLSNTVSSTDLFLVIGLPGAGRTSFIRRLTDFKYGPTVSSLSTEVTPSLQHSGRTIQLVAPPPPLPPKFDDLNHLDKAKGVFLIYDPYDPAGFNSLTAWIDAASSTLPFVLLASKSDYQSAKAKVPNSTGSGWASIYGAPFLEISSKSGLNCNEALAAMIKATSS